MSNIHNFVISGGVAANQYIRHHLKALCDENSTNFYAPPLELCTDNGAMIAWAALENDAIGSYDSLNLAPRPRWPLTELKPL